MRAYYSPILVTIAIAALIAGCSTTNPEGTDASGAPVTDATKKPGAETTPNRTLWPLCLLRALRVVPFFVSGSSGSA